MQHRKNVSDPQIFMDCRPFFCSTSTKKIINSLFSMFSAVILTISMDFQPQFEDWKINWKNYQKISPQFDVQSCKNFTDFSILQSSNIFICSWSELLTLTKILWFVPLIPIWYQCLFGTRLFGSRDFYFGFLKFCFFKSN